MHGLEGYKAKKKESREAEEEGKKTARPKKSGGQCILGRTVVDGKEVAAHFRILGLGPSFSPPPSELGRGLLATRLGGGCGRGQA